MNCYRSLVAVNFIANAPTEIRKAHKLIVTDVGMIGAGNGHCFDSAVNKLTYYDVGNNLGFFNELYTRPIEKGCIYYLQYDKFMMAVTRSKAIIDNCIQAAMNVNGDVPLYRTTHTINKVRVHTVLFNTSFTIPPVSPN